MIKNELFLTTDGKIAKYVHPDGSETSIKTWPKDMETCGGSGRNKFNVFASCSVGCYINCGFCFLTSKKYIYNFLSPKEIATNVISAIKEELIRRPELSQIPFNLSWMGMGDAWPIIDQIAYATQYILDAIVPLVDNVEGVDIATTLPSMSYDDIKYLDMINKLLKDTNKLTTRPETRTAVRVFYSLHSMFNKTRMKLIPKTLPVDAALCYLNSVSQKYNVIYHYMFLDKINDDSDHIMSLKHYFSKIDNQLRILRYNQCSNSRYKESVEIDNIVKSLYNILGDNLKIQLSPGSEISAACGMFLMKHYKK